MKFGLLCLLFGCVGLLLVACPASEAPTPNPGNPDAPSPPVPGVSNTLLYKGSQYSLSNGLIRPGSSEGYHVVTRLSVADGTYYPTTVYYGNIPVTVMQVAAGEAIIDVSLYTAGDTFAAGTYTFVAPVESGPVPTLYGQNYFKGGEISIDTNGSGDIDEGETFDIAGGTITVQPLSGGMRLIYDLTLPDGSGVVASYERPVWDPKKPGTVYPGPGTPPEAPPPDPNACSFLITQDISVPTSLKDTAAVCDYLLDGLVTVTSKLTVEPGVVIRAKPSAGLIVKKGELSAVGTAASPITFEGLEPLKGFWNGVHFKDARDSYLHFVNLKDAGREACRLCNSAALSTLNTAVSLEDFSQSNSYVNGVYIGGELLSFKRNRFSDNAGVGISLLTPELISKLDIDTDYLGSEPNGKAYIRIARGKLDEAVDRRWSSLGAPLFFETSVEVQAGTLSLDPGTDIIVSGSEFKIAKDSQLNAQGSAATPITFRGDKDENSDWEGVYLLGSLANTLNHVNIKNAEWGVYLEDEASLSLSNSFIEAKYGVFCDTGYAKTDKNTLELGPNNRFDTREFDIDPACVVTP